MHVGKAHGHRHAVAQRQGTKLVTALGLVEHDLRRIGHRGEMPDAGVEGHHHARSAQQTQRARHRVVGRFETPRTRVGRNVNALGPRSCKADRPAACLDFRRQLGPGPTALGVGVGLRARSEDDIHRIRFGQSEDRLGMGLAVRQPRAEIGARPVFLDPRGGACGNQRRCRGPGGELAAGGGLG